MCGQMWRAFNINKWQICADREFIKTACLASALWFFLLLLIIILVPFHRKVIRPLVHVASVKIEISTSVVCPSIEASMSFEWALHPPADTQQTRNHFPRKQQLSDMLSHINKVFDADALTYDKQNYFPAMYALIINRLHTPEPMKEEVGKKEVK